MRKINPLVLLLINCVLPFLPMLSGASGQPYFLFIFSSLLLLYYREYRRWGKFAIAFALFGLASSFLMPYSNPYINMLNMVLFAGFSFMPMLMISSLLFYNYQPSEILYSLQSLRLNRKLAIALIITLRYFPTFQNEFKIMKGCMAMRGIAFSWKKPVKSFAYFITPQLFRCSLLAEELTGAGLSKGIDYPAKRTSVCEIRWTALEWFILLLFVSGLAVMLFYKRLNFS